MKQGKILDSLFRRQSPALKDLICEINVAASKARDVLLEHGFSDADIDDALAGGAAIYQQIADSPKTHKAADYCLQVLETAAEIQNLIEEPDFLSNPRMVASALGLSFQCGLGFGINPTTRDADISGEYLTEQAHKRHRGDNEAKRTARDLAREYWKQDLNRTTSDTTSMIRIKLNDSGLLNYLGQPYKHDTVYSWIKDLAPPHIRRGGRPKGS